eukprot:6094622-Amphidinium_carterae.1
MAKSKGKGKSSKLPHSEADEEQEFRQAILASLPHAAQQRARTTLVSTFNVPVAHPEEMRGQAAVCLVAKKDIPQLLARVGHSLQAVAMLSVQPAHELHMPGYRSSPVSVQVEVSTSVGRELTTVVRQITQLGFGTSIVELQEPGPIVVAPITMQKVGVKFARNATALWSTATPALVA